MDGLLISSSPGKPINISATMTHHKPKHNTTTSTKHKDVQRYGVWFARPIKYRVEYAGDDAFSPHIYLKFSDASQDDFEAAINIKSGKGDETRLVYWISESLDPSFVSDFKDLEPGFQSLEGNAKGLDYLRDRKLFVQSTGKILPHDIPGKKNDIIDYLTPLLDRSIKEKATIYIFGSQYKDGTGIHDVHMNQGSLPQFDSGVQQDGALFFHFEEAEGDGEWVGVFLAFASQRVPTDEKTGWPLKDAKSWVEILEKK
jgi:uncharacterized protein YukJ